MDNAKTWAGWIELVGQDEFLRGMMAGRFVQDQSASEWGGPPLYRKVGP